jgi:hypothetical protein
MDVRQHVPRPAIISVIVFAVVFAVHAYSPVTTSADSRYSIHTAESIILQGNTNLDEFRADYLADPAGQYCIYPQAGHLYSNFPVGGPLIAVPFVYVADKALPYALAASPALRQRLHVTAGPPYDQKFIAHLVVSKHDFAEKVVASFVIALTAVFIFFIGMEFLTPGMAVLPAIAFAFGTAAWSTASRAMWMHGPSMLCLTIALYLLVVARRRPEVAQFASLPLAFSYVQRPTNAISIVLLTCYVAIHHRKQLLRYLLWSLVVAIPFFAYNLRAFHAPLQFYYVGAAAALTGVRFWEGMAGQFISPSRGIFVYSPILAFGILGAVWGIRGKQLVLLDSFLIGIIMLHIIPISLFAMWWGGHCYGPRYFSDMIPYFTYFLILTLAGLPKLTAGTRALLIAGLSVTFLVSFYMNAVGAFIGETQQWNAIPVDVTNDPSRLWDWHDPPFLRGVRPYHVDLLKMPVTPRAIKPPVALKPSDPAIAAGGFTPGDAQATWFWSMAEFRGPVVTVPRDRDIQVFLHLHGFTPGYRPELKVTATKGGDMLFDQRLDGLALEKSRIIGPITVPASVHRGNLDLTWKADTWVPAESVANSSDTRHLGLDVETIEVR